MSYLIIHQPQPKTIVGRTPKDSRGTFIEIGDWVKIDGKRYRVSSLDYHVTRHGSTYEMWEWTLQAEVSDVRGYFHVACPTRRCEVCNTKEEA